MRNRKSLLLTLAMMTVFGVGCQKKEIVMEYNPHLHRVAVRVKPGDVIRWTNVNAEWKLQSPCTVPNGDTCTIAEKPKGKLYSYRCVDGQYCDPEILIDDGTRLDRSSATTSTDSPGDVGVQIGCDDSKKAQHVEPELNTEGAFSVSKGNTVSWEAIGDYSHDDIPWNLDFGTYSPSDLCTKADAITKKNPMCVVKPDAMSVSYSIHIEGCTDSQMIKITPQ
jgi:hypothetical protein